MLEKNPGSKVMRAGATEPSKRPFEAPDGAHALDERPEAFRRGDIRLFREEEKRPETGRGTWPPLLALNAPSLAGDAALVVYPLTAQTFMPALRFCGLNGAHAFALPLLAACYRWFTVESAWRHVRGRGGAGKAVIWRPPPARTA